jgi:hypothetical protein
MKTGFLSGISFAVLAGLVGIVGLALPAPAFGGEDEPVITAQVANYSQASPAVLAAAEREAGRILGLAGLRASWLECSVKPSTAAPQDLCRQELQATDIRMRILPAPVLDKTGDSVFGFAIHPILASLYYELALRRAKRDDAEFELPIILGCVMAHELGHLLLGPNSHSGLGIMHRQWRSREIQLALMGTLVFASDQSKLMRLEARARSNRQKTALSSSTP